MKWKWLLARREDPYRPDADWGASDSGSSQRRAADKIKDNTTDKPFAAYKIKDNASLKKTPKPHEDGESSAK